MKPEEWLALAARAIGLVWILSGLNYLLDAFLLNLGYFQHPDSSPAYYLIVGLSLVVLGLYFLSGAPLLIKFAYSVAGGAAESNDEENRPPEPS